MNWLMGGILAAVTGALAGELGARVAEPPALVLVCQRGWRTEDLSHIAFGYDCELMDRDGVRPVGAVSLYDDAAAVP